MTQLDIEARTRLQERRAILLRTSGSDVARDPLDEVSEIDAALVRITEGKYGHCEACGRALGRQRLRALPTARYCLDCSSNDGRSGATQR